MEQSQQVDDTHGVGHCAWHPAVETRLSCSHCGKSICTQCLVQAPVGIRCRECGRPEKMPTFDVQPNYYARAVGVGVAISVGGGLVWLLFNLLVGGVPYVSALAALAVGYGAGELISASVNRKRSRGLAWIAAAAVAGAYLISLTTNPFGVSFLGLICLGVAVYVAVLKVK
jgi:hypothetical protein